jgi:hypothetical protein
MPTIPPIPGVGLPGIPLPPTPTLPPAIKLPDDAWLAKISKCGAELKVMASDMAEQAKAYASTMIPQTTPNTFSPAGVNAGSLAAAINAGQKTAALATDISKVATTLPQFTTMVTTVNSMVDAAKTQATAALTTKANALPNARRQSQLYADEARTQITDTKTKVAAHYDLKKELVKF